MENDKLNKLAARSKDKSLPREERQRAAAELEWEKFRLDKRPVMTFKKNKFYELLSSLSSALCFGFMSFSEITGIKSPLFPAIIIIMAAVLFVWVSKQGKYKTEPADELAKANMTKAGNLSFLILFMAAIFFVFIMGLVTNLEGTFTISWYSLLFVLVAFSSLQAALQKIVFFKLDGKETAEEE